MRKLLLTVTGIATLSVMATAAPTGAQARFGAGLLPAIGAGGASAEPVQYYGGYRSYYAPRYYTPRYYYAPRYRDYTTRDALDRCDPC